MFFFPRWVRYAAPLYWMLLLAGLLDRFTLMLHCTAHRPLFRAKYRALNLIIPCLLAPFFGQTPHTYFAHHLGMHHREENLRGDLSSTMRFQRDSFVAWSRYWARLLSFGAVELVRYMAQHGQHRLLRRVVAGETAYWSLFVLLLYLRPDATLVVLVVPLLLIRTLMMIGNWGQHAFIDLDRPENPYAASVTCINSRYNRRCFNDGYHIGHHLHARAHWTEYPAELELNLQECGRQDAIVFEGLDFFQVWLLLMTGRWSRLARAFVQLPGARPRDQAEIIRLLQERVRAVPALCEAAADGAPMAAAQIDGSRDRRSTIGAVKTVSLPDTAVAWTRAMGTRLMATCPDAKAQFEKDPSIRDVYDD
jgi:fatty acid desaturase